MRKSLLMRGKIIYRFAWSSYPIQCPFVHCIMSISNPSFLFVIRPLTAQCSWISDYCLSIKIALLSAGPALGRVFTFFLQQSHWNMFLVLNSTSVPWYSLNLGLLGASLFSVGSGLLSWLFPGAWNLGIQGFWCSSMPWLSFMWSHSIWETAKSQCAQPEGGTPRHWKQCHLEQGVLQSYS